MDASSNHEVRRSPKVHSSHRRPLSDRASCFTQVIIERQPPPRPIGGATYTSRAHMSHRATSKNLETCFGTRRISVRSHFSDLRGIRLTRPRSPVASSAAPRRRLAQNASAASSPLALSRYPASDSARARSVMCGPGRGRLTADPCAALSRERLARPLRVLQRMDARAVGLRAQNKSGGR